MARGERPARAAARRATPRRASRCIAHWEKRLFEARWAVVSWPKAYGGREASLVEWLIFEEEYYRAGAPQRIAQNGIFLLAPTLFHFGTRGAAGSHPAADGARPRTSGRRAGPSRTPGAISRASRAAPCATRRAGAGGSPGRRRGARAAPSATGCSASSAAIRRRERHRGPDLLPRPAAGAGRHRAPGRPPRRRRRLRRRVPRRRLRPGPRRPRQGARRVERRDDDRELRARPHAAQPRALRRRRRRASSSCAVARRRAARSTRRCATPSSGRGSMPRRTASTPCRRWRKPRRTAGASAPRRASTRSSGRRWTCACTRRRCASSAPRAELGGRAAGRKGFQFALAGPDLRRAPTRSSATSSPSACSACRGRSRALRLHPGAARHPRRRARAPRARVPAGARARGVGERRRAGPGLWAELARAGRRRACSRRRSEGGLGLTELDSCSSSRRAGASRCPSRWSRRRPSRCRCCATRRPRALARLVRDAERRSWRVGPRRRRRSWRARTRPTSSSCEHDGELHAVERARRSARAQRFGRRLSPPLRGRRGPRRPRRACSTRERGAPGPRRRAAIAAPSRLAAQLVGLARAMLDDDRGVREGAPPVRQAQSAASRP